MTQEIQQMLDLEMSKFSGILDTRIPPFMQSTSVLGLGVDFVFPLSQQQEQQQEEPSPKSIRRGCTRSMRFDT